MVTSNTSTSKAPSSPNMSTASGLDSPPSYDYVASLPNDDYPYSPAAAAQQQAGGSSSSSAPAARTAGNGEVRGPPKHIEHLFSGPPNAERLLARNSTPLERVANITTHRKWGRSVTFDPALQDPDTLFDFIRYQALQVLPVKLKIQGSHLEHHQKTETVRNDDGSFKTRRKGETERVIDFDFWIDLQKVLDHPENTANIHVWTTPPAHPAERGTIAAHWGALYRAPDQTAFPGLRSPGDVEGYTPLLPSGEYSITDVGARFHDGEQGCKTREWSDWLSNKGRPPWSRMAKTPEFWDERAASGKKGKSAVGPLSLPEDDQDGRRFGFGRGAGGGMDEEAAVETEIDPAERGSKEQALRAWCLKYCQDPGILKSFTVRRWFWGWEMAALETAVRGAILSAGYQSNDVKVEWSVGDWYYTVRPPNLFSRLVWDTPWFLMPLLLLLYPLIWLWQRAYSSAGAPYTVARASYAFKFYPPLPSTFPNETLEAAQDRLPALYKLHPELPKSPVLQPGPKGIHYLLGRKEGEWFREWEERIRMGVRMRYKGELQDTRVGEHEAPMLDGY